MRYQLLEDGFHPSRLTAEKMIFSIRKDIWTNHLVLLIIVLHWNLLNYIVMGSSALALLILVFHFISHKFVAPETTSYGSGQDITKLIISTYSLRCCHLSFSGDQHHSRGWVGSSAPYQVGADVAFCLILFIIILAWAVHGYALTVAVLKYLCLITSLQHSTYCFSKGMTDVQALPLGHTSSAKIKETQY